MKPGEKRFLLFVGIMVTVYTSALAIAVHSSKAATAEWRQHCQRHGGPGKQGGMSPCLPREKMQHPTAIPTMEKKYGK